MNYIKTQKRQISFIVFLLFLLSGWQTQVLSQGTIIDHTCTDITSIPESAINQAKTLLHIGYGHTSHGSQLTTGMTGLVTFANSGGLGLSHPPDIFKWNNGGTDGALDLEEGDGYGTGWLDHDCGYYPAWVNETRTYLDDPSHEDVNVIIWSWCGQAKYRTEQEMIDTYLSPMSQLESDYPQVQFVYMTGHANGTGESGNLHLRNQQIRNYCIINNKVLYDFYDIECYDPDGNYFGDKNVNDDCSYTGGNWATEWQNAHTENVDWYDCLSEHSEPLNANRKAYAAWWLWASLAGWNPVTVTSVFLNPQKANATSAYTVDFTVTSQLTANSGTMTFTFPDNTLIPSTIATSEVTVNTDPSFAVSANPTNRTITVMTPITLSGAVQVIIAAGAGIENPSATGNYALQVATSAQPILATSPQYLITPTDSSVTITNIDILPNTPSTLARFTMNFSTSDNGRMVSGASSIYVIMPVDASFTQGVPATSKILINSTAAKSVTLYNGNAVDADTIAAVIPNSVTIGNGSNITFFIDATAGFQTPSSSSSLTYRAFTSVDNIIESLDYSLPVELSSFAASSKRSGVCLTWVTESELNNVFWTLERMMIDKKEFDLFKEDGSAQNEEYQLLAEIDGMGTVSTKTKYEYMDNSVDVGSYYIYRISDVAYDGNVTYHNPVIIEVMPPSEFVLKQNYPNPFNPRTVIRYLLPVVSEVNLTIYNSVGQKVRTLYSGQRNAGAFEVTWNGKNDHGSRVSSGIYFYSIQAGRFADVKKMIILE